MAIPILIYSIFIVGAVLLIFAIGCGLYLLQQYCFKSAKDKKKLQTSANRPGDGAALSHKDQADDVSVNSTSAKAKTFEQILNQERVAHSLHPLRLPQPPTASESAQKTAAEVPSEPVVKKSKTKTPPATGPIQLSGDAITMRMAASLPSGNLRSRARPATQGGREHVFANSHKTCASAAPPDSFAPFINLFTSNAIKRPLFDLTCLLFLLTKATKWSSPRRTYLRATSRWAT